MGEMRTLKTYSDLPWGAMTESVSVNDITATD